jgi:D-glycero-alpha-D-manno-heptose-7-phosphate kinase
LIISRTPFRISFFGGGTDYPAWYREHGGAVLAATIDKYCYLSCRYLPPFFEHRFRIVYSKIENRRSVDEIEHPAVREVLKYLRMDRGIEIHHDGDLPARSGMGSSSSFTVGLLNSLHALEGRMPTKDQLAREGIEVEQDKLRENVGSQDQVCAAHGGFNHIRFLPGGGIDVRPMTLRSQRVAELSQHLMLLFTGVQRTASKVVEGYAAETEGRQTEGRQTATRMVGAMVDEAISILTSSQDISTFGRLLHEGWQAKQGLGEGISNKHVETIYEAARRVGALGGKLLGAGGGGFMLLFAPPDRHAKIRETLSGLLHVPFAFEFSGSQVIFHTKEQDYLMVEKERKERDLTPFRELAGDEPTS